MRYGSAPSGASVSAETCDPNGKVSSLESLGFHPAQAIAPGLPLLQRDDDVALQRRFGIIGQRCPVVRDDRAVLKQRHRASP